MSLTSDEKLAKLSRVVKRLEDRLFRLGAMNDPPCFCCGYNGPNYYQPDTHKCAERHHKLYKENEF